MLCQKKYNATKLKKYKIEGTPFPDAKKRIGQWSYKAFAERYEERTLGGRLLLTREQKREVTVAFTNVILMPLMNTHPKKLTNDSLHITSGIANREMDKVREKIRLQESDNPFYMFAVKAQRDVDHLLNCLCLTPQNEDKKNSQKQLLLPLHRESLLLRSKNKELAKKGSKLEKERKRLGEMLEDDEDDDDLTLT